MPKKLLIIGWVWPEPNATAAGVRMLELIHFFLRSNYNITFASTAKPIESLAHLTELGIECKEIVLNNPSFDIFIQELQPNIVIFDRFITEEQFGWRVAKHLPDALRILDTEDLHSLRKVREQAFKEGSTFTIEQWKNSDITKREIASIYRCDCSFIISSYEMELLQQIHVPKSLLFYLPFMLPEISEKDSRQLVPYDDRANFICIGNGIHQPNVDAVLYLKKHIWPLIRKELPKVSLHIYGAYLPQKITQLHQPKENFLVLGKAKDAKEVMQQARINLAPLRFGAGIKGKLITAMQTGTPSICTTTASEGMHGNLPWPGAIEDSPEAFANAAVQLYTHPSAWEVAQKRVIPVINTIYNDNILSAELKKYLHHLEKHKEAHRNSNFTGAMLQHHTMASAVYMSKWIEAKNNKNNN